jgi:hypothetical protein
VSQRTFSGPPAIPTTRQPAIRASCATVEPVEPAAPLITTVSPGKGRPMLRKPK